MNKIIAALLKKYDPDDKELFLKAKFVLFTTLFLVFIQSVILIYTSYLAGIDTTIVFIETLGFVSLLFALGVLIKGNYGLAIHTILIIGFTTTWLILFIGPPTSLITKLDTIVFVIGLLCAMPLMFFKNRKPMVVYFLINILLFLIFNYYLYRVTDLTPIERLDYFLDNLVVMIFVFFVSFSLFSIYQQALNSLRKELEERKKAEKALLESEHQHSTHLQNTPVGAVSWDLEFKVVQWNPAAEAIFGYTKEEAIGNHVADLILAEDLRQIVENVFQDLLAGRGGKRNINDNLTKSGDRIICDWYNTTLKNTDAVDVKQVVAFYKTYCILPQNPLMTSDGLFEDPFSPMRDFCYYCCNF